MLRVTDIMNKEVEYQVFIRNYFNFGTAFSFAFFDLPENYNFSDITEVINHSYIDSSGKIQNYRKTGLKNFSNVKIYREKDYFNCYLKGL